MEKLKKTMDKLKRHETTKNCKKNQKSKNNFAPFVFRRYGASACFAAFHFLLVAAVGMGPTAPLRLLLMVGVLFCASGFVRAGG